MAHRIGREDVVFNHNPKCGGEWVREVCKKAGCYLRLDGKGRWPSHTLRWAPFTFTFVRHPYAWFTSWHAFKKRKPGSKKNFLMPLWREDLNETVQLICQHNPGFFEDRHAKYTTPPARCVSVVGKQEFLAEHLASILHLAGVSFDAEILGLTPPMNVSIHEQELSAETIKAIDSCTVNFRRQFYPDTAYSSNSVKIFLGGL